MTEIFDKDGKRVRYSKNLAGFYAHIREFEAVFVQLTTFEDEAEILVFFRNGDACRLRFASLNVAKERLRVARNLRGVALCINGESRGIISRDNRALLWH